MNKKLLLNSRLFLSSKIVKIDRSIKEAKQNILKLKQEIKMREQEEKKENWWKE